MPMHIAIAGNIGSGKTSLTEKLARHYGWKACFESVDDNPYLADFYEDMERWAFHLQVYFMSSRFRQIQEFQKTKQSIVQDRTLYEDAHIFASSLYHSGYFNRRDFENYQKLYESMIPYVQAPDLLIYLRADIAKLVDQIEKRGRSFENSIRIDYLKTLNRYYEEWVGDYDHGKRLIINVNHLDFVNNPEDFATIVERIDAELHGLFS